MMVSNDFLCRLVDRYSMYLFGGTCIVVVMNHFSKIVISCKQSDGSIEYTADYVFDYDGIETADLVGIDVTITDTVNDIDLCNILSTGDDYCSNSILQFVVQMIIDKDLDPVHSSSLIVKDELTYGCER